jgi:hypothetical protein
MLVLPDKPIKAAHRNPRTTLLYAKPKQGKTTVLSGLEGLLLVDTEKGSDFVDAMKIQVNNFQELREVAGLIFKKGWNETTKVYTPPYQYIAVDTLTRIDEWSEIEGTFRYMDKPQGKKFNRIGGDPKAPALPVTHPEFETVHEIGQGFGYRYSREVVVKFFESFSTLAPHVFYICHVKDKLVGTTNTGGEVFTKEINLTGRLKDIIASKVDTIAYGYREENKFIMSFAGEEGTRSPHLSGKKITVSESSPLTKEEYETAKIASNSDSLTFIHNRMQYMETKLSDGTSIYQKIEFFWDRIFLK